MVYRAKYFLNIEHTITSECHVFIYFSLDYIEMEFILHICFLPKCF